MIEEIKLSSIVTLLIFGGMFLGGSSIQFMSLLLKRNSLYLQLFCGGLLVGLFAFELLPDVFSDFQMIGIVTGISIGIFIMFMMEIVLHKNTFQTKQTDTIYLLFVALFIHSIPAGISFGMSLQSGQIINYGLLIAFFLHHVPEGMVIMASMPFIKKKNKLFVTFCFMLSMIIGLNIFMGMNMRVDSIKVTTIMMGMTIGTIGYVTFYELLWKKAKYLSKGKVTLAVVLGIVSIHFFLQLLPTHQ